MGRLLKKRGAWAPQRLKICFRSSASCLQTVDMFLQTCWLFSCKIHHQLTQRSFSFDLPQKTKAPCLESSLCWDIYCKGLNNCSKPATVILYVKKPACQSFYAKILAKKDELLVFLQLIHLGLQLFKPFLFVRKFFSIIAHYTCNIFPKKLCLLCFLIV